MAIYAGLKLPILNPLDKELMGAIDAFEVLNYSDVNAEDYISRHMNDVVAKPGAAPAPGTCAEGQAPSDAELIRNKAHAFCCLDYFLLLSARRKNERVDNYPLM